MEDSARALQVMDAVGAGRGGGGADVYSGVLLSCSVQLTVTQTQMCKLLSCNVGSNSHATLNRIEEGDHLHDLKRSK